MDCSQCRFFISSDDVRRQEDQQFGFGHRGVGVGEKLAQPGNVPQKGTLFLVTVLGIADQTRDHQSLAVFHHHLGLDGPITEFRYLHGRVAYSSPAVTSPLINR